MFSLCMFFFSQVHDFFSMNYKSPIVSVRKQPDLLAPRRWGSFACTNFPPGETSVQAKCFACTNSSPGETSVQAKRFACTNSSPGERSLAARSKERRLFSQAIPSPAKLNTISQSRYQTHGFEMRPQIQCKLSVFIRGAPDTREGVSAKQDPFLRRAPLELNSHLPPCLKCAFNRLKNAKK